MNLDHVFPVFAMCCHKVYLAVVVMGNGYVLYIELDLGGRKKWSHSGGRNDKGQVFTCNRIAVNVQLGMPR